jgi:hypothetical protein
MLKKLTNLANLTKAPTTVSFSSPLKMIKKRKSTDIIKKEKKTN